MTQYLDARNFTKDMQKLLTSNGTTEESGDVETGIKTPKVICDCRPGLFGRLWHQLRRRNIIVSQTEKAANDWTMTHSFLAIMGGFATGVSENGKPALVGGHKRVALDPKTLLWVFKNETSSIPSLSKSDIEDKSKADGLAKLIVIIQALWFCLQCVVRLAQNLSISLLELNTFGHAICAFLIFAVWWKKPQDIVEPFLLSGFNMREIGAALTLYGWHGTFPAWTQTVLGVPRPKYTRLDLDTNETKPLRTISGIPSNYFGDSSQLLSYQQILQMHAQKRSGYPGSRRRKNIENEGLTRNPVIGRFYADQKIFGFSFTCKAAWPAIRPMDYVLDYFSSWKSPYACMRRGVLNFERPFIELEASDVLMLQLASKAIRRYQFPEKTSVDWRRINFPEYNSVAESQGLTFLFGFVGLCYGGLHLLAWNAPFPNPAAKYLWRISGNCIAAVSIVFYVSLSSLQISLSIDSHRKTLDPALRKLKSLRTSFHELSAWAGRTKFLDSLNISLADVARQLLGFAAILFWLPIIAFFTGLFLLYPVARVFLVVECFINLAHLPDSAYQEPEWSRYFPHIF